MSSALQQSTDVASASGSSKHSSPFRLGYRPALDGLRGLAILAVMGFHARLPGTHGGFLGVDVFFVISGFLITSLLLEERRRHGSNNFKRFYIRRGLRLFPALFVLLVFYLVHALVLDGARRSNELKEIAFTLGYVMNWALSFDWVKAGNLSHTWSLAIEEQFYVLWPAALLILLAVFRSRLLPIAATLVAAIVAIALWRARVYHPGPGIAYYRAFFGLDTRGDGLLLGCLVSFVMYSSALHQHRIFKALMSVGAVVASVAIAAIMIMGRNQLAAYYYDRYLISFVVAGVAVIVAHVVMAPASAIARLLSLRPLVWLGRISYSLYLWHIPVFLAVGRRDFSLPTTALRVGLSVAIASLSFSVIEQRFLRLKVRFGSSGQPEGRAE